MFCLRVCLCAHACLVSKEVAKKGAWLSSLELGLQRWVQELILGPLEEWPSLLTVTLSLTPTQHLSKLKHFLCHFQDFCVPFNFSANTLSKCWALGPWLYPSQHPDIYQQGFLHSEARMPIFSVSETMCWPLVPGPVWMVHIWQTLDVAWWGASWWSWSWPLWLTWWFHPSTALRVSIPWWNPYSLILSCLILEHQCTRKNTRWMGIIIYLFSSEFSGLT